MQVRQGVILAAGKGSRIFPLSKSYPKPLLPVLNKPVMQYQLEIMREAGIDEITIVIGSLGSQIKMYFGDGSKFKVKISYVFDRNPCGIASSLMKARNKISGPFALFLGDIFVAGANITPAVRRMEATSADGIIIGKVETDIEAVRRNFSITTNTRGRVLKVIEKPKNPASLFKGYGFYLFSPAIFEAISKTGRSTLRNEYEITDSIQTLIDLDGRVYSEEWKNWDFNLSFPKDLLDCNLKMLKENKLDYLIGHEAEISRGSRIVASVVGDRSQIKNRIDMVQCLVLPDTTIDENIGSLHRYIFTNELALPA